MTWVFARLQHGACARAASGRQEVEVAAMLAHHPTLQVSTASLGPGPLPSPQQRRERSKLHDCADEGQLHRRCLRA